MIILSTQRWTSTITPPQVKNYFDLGYHGIENDFPDLKAVLPIKKKRNIEHQKRKEIQQET